MRYFGPFPNSWAVRESAPDTEDLRHCGPVRTPPSPAVRGPACCTRSSAAPAGLRGVDRQGLCRRRAAGQPVPQRPASRDVVDDLSQHAGHTRCTGLPGRPWCTGTRSATCRRCCTSTIRRERQGRGRGYCWRRWSECQSVNQSWQHYLEQPLPGKIWVNLEPGAIREEPWRRWSVEGKAPVMAAYENERAWMGHGRGKRQPPALLAREQTASRGEQREALRDAWA